MKNVAKWIAIAVVFSCLMLVALVAVAGMLPDPPETSTPEVVTKVITATPEPIAPTAVPPTSTPRPAATPDRGVFEVTVQEAVDWFHAQYGGMEYTDVADDGTPFTGVVTPCYGFAAAGDPDEPAVQIALLLNLDGVSGCDMDEQVNMAIDILLAYGNAETLTYVQNSLQSLEAGDSVSQIAGEIYISLEYDYNYQFSMLLSDTSMVVSQLSG